MSESQATSRSLDRRCAWLLFFFLNAVFILTSTGRVHTQDENMTLLTTESLALRQTTELAPQEITRGFYGRYDVRGHARSAYGFAHSALLVPWFMVGTLAQYLSGLSATAVSFAVAFPVVLSSATFSAGTVAMMFMLFRALAAPLGVSLMAALAVAFSTPIFAYSAWMFSEPLLTFLVVSAAYACFGLADTEELSARRGFWAGLLLGYAVLVRPTAIILAPLFVLAILVARRRQGVRPAIDLVLMVVLGAAFTLAYNAAVFGSPFEFGYPDVAEGGRQLNTFRTPVFRGLMGFLFAPGKSIFIFAPAILLSIAAMPRLWRRNKGLAVAAYAAPIAYLLFFSRYTSWEGGFSYGPRYLVPALTLLAVGVAAFFHESPKRWRVFGYALVLAGFAVQVLGISVSFTEAAVNGYYDPRWDYRMDYNAVGQHLRVLSKYLSDPNPAPAGVGFDRWFVFLHREGFSTAALWGMAAPVLCVAFASAFGLYRCVRQQRKNAPAMVDSATAHLGG